MTKKILIADDSLMMRSVIKNYVKAIYPDVEFIDAGDGAEAVSKFKQSAPDLIFMDIIMPGTNGIEASKQIKAINSQANIIVCSSVDEQGVTDELNEIGVKEKVTKPFKKEEIEPLVNKYLS